MLVADYLLPGISGVELIHKIKRRYPGIEGDLHHRYDRAQGRAEMLSAGAVAMFDKPIPLADFLDAVERSVGLVRTIFPPEPTKEGEEHRNRFRAADWLSSEGHSRCCLPDQ